MSRLYASEFIRGFLINLNRKELNLKKTIQSLLSEVSNLKVFNLLFLLLFIFINFNIDSVKAQMYWNQAAHFAGNSASYISIPNSTSLNITGSFSIEAWINPVNTNNKGVISKGGTLLKYAIRITASRVVLITNGAPRLSSKTTSLIPVNKWTHIAATFNSSTNESKIYINGILDTSAVSGGIPTTNTDSLYVGFSGASTPFNGQLDEVRLWNRDLSESEVNKYMRTSLGNSSGVYSGLVLSMTFQRQSNITPFTSNDFSGNGNNGLPRNITAGDQSYQPYHTIVQNECIELDGIEDYLSGYEESGFFPTSEILFECWYYPRDGNMSTLFRKASGSGTAFSVSVSSVSIKVIINNMPRILHVGHITHQWTHIAVTFSTQTNIISYYQNGVHLTSLSFIPGDILPSTDSLYIGRSDVSTEFFNGFIDEMRITDEMYTDREIDFRLFNSIEASDDTQPSVNNVCYNFDGNTFDNGEDGGPVLYFRNGGSFSHPAQSVSKPQSPLMNVGSGDYHKAFYCKPNILRIPVTGTEGTIENIQKCYQDYTITDVDVFVILNHQQISDIEISIFKKNTPDSLVIFDGSTANSSDNNLALLFDDQSDSSIKTNTYSSFCSSIKPLNNMNSFFSGKIIKGEWGIRIRDKVSGNTGRLYTWGLRFNNMTEIEYNFDLVSLMQGFFNPALNVLTQDTIYAYLHETASPYNVVSSSKSYVTAAGVGNFSFGNINYLQEYYLDIRHRNTIETWGSNTLRFSENALFYRFDFTDTTVFGNNEILMNSVPPRYAMYSGDVNQDGTIDLTDGSLIDNDAFNFNSGYLPTDVNGDGIIDVSDAVFADNNGFNFVGKITP